MVRFVELEGFDRAMALAGQAFAALLPLLIVISSISPSDSDDLSQSSSPRFQLDSDAADTLQSAVAQPPTPASGAIGGVLLVVSALSFTRRCSGSTSGPGGSPARPARQRLGARVARGVRDLLVASSP